MIKICSPQLGLSPRSHLGGENHDYKMINALCNRGFSVEVLLPNKRPYQSHRNLKIEYLPIKHIFPPHIFSLLALPYLINKYRSNKFDILRIHSPFYLGFGACIFHKLFPKVKIVTSIHLAETRPDFKWILRNTIKVYDHIFTVSNYLKKWLVDEYHFDPQKITVIYSGVGEELKPERKDLRLVKKYHLQNKVILLNLGLMDNRKNVMFLLDLFAKLSMKYSNICLFLIGSGPLKPLLVQRIQKQGWQDRVFILDPVFKKEKNNFFNLADIFLFPSRNEGFGAVAAEAMGCGKPVVVSNNTSLPEVVDNNVNGFLAKTDGLEDWLRKTEILIKDAKLRRKFGSKGLIKARTVFSWKVVVDKTIKEYNKLVQ